MTKGHLKRTGEPRKGPAECPRADYEGPDDRSRGGRSLPRRGRPSIGLHAWSASMNVIHDSIVHTRLLAKYASVRRANAGRLVEARRALPRTSRSARRGAQDRFAGSYLSSSGTERRTRDRPGCLARRAHRRDRRGRCRPIARLIQVIRVKPLGYVVMIKRSLCVEFGGNASRFVRCAVGS